MRYETNLKSVVGRVARSAFVVSDGALEKGDILLFRHTGALGWSVEGLELAEMQKPMVGEEEVFKVAKPEKK